jgi:lactate dehydrogenase-like 2-hydroxyacid dehydrogenase
MIAAGFGCDLHYFIKHAKGKIEDELLRELSKIDLDTVAKNSSFVAMKVMIHKDWQNKGVGERCLY